ncbi:MAG: diacylglycerol kinase family protein [Myxococcota bacterium]
MSDGARDAAAGPRRVFAIINGAAGGGRCATLADDALAGLSSAGVRLEVRRTEGPGHATELAREAWREGYRAFLAVGGDGTGYEVVNGLFAEGTPAERPALGLLPLGTGNSFLRDFGIADANAAATRIARALRSGGQAVDVVRATHAEGAVHYINILGLGFTAAAGDLTNRRFKRLGDAGYVAAVLACVARLEHPVDPIALDEGEADRRPAVLLSFNNSKFTAGKMKMAPSADVSDGALDVIRVELGRAALLRTFPRIFAGTHVRHPKVEEARARHVRFLEPRRQPVMIDGEIMELALEALEVQPGALEVLV